MLPFSLLIAALPYKYLLAFTYVSTFKHLLAVQPFLTISNTSPFQTLHDFIHYFAFWLFLFFIHSFFTLSLTLSHHFLVVFKSFSIFSFSILIFNLYTEYFNFLKKHSKMTVGNTFPFSSHYFLRNTHFYSKKLKKSPWGILFHFRLFHKKQKKGVGWDSNQGFQNPQSNQQPKFSIIILVGL